MSADPAVSPTTHEADAGPDPGFDVDALAGRFRAVLPHTAARSAPLARALYRLLADGEPVTWDALARAAEAAGVPDASPGELQATVRGWPGLYEEPEGITGFGGLSIRPVSQHRLLVDGRPLYTRCAWDLLFLPELLGRTLAATSLCAETGATVRLEVGPEAVRALSPPGAVLSMVAPRPEMAEDLTSLF